MGLWALTALRAVWCPWRSHEGLLGLTRLGFLDGTFGPVWG